MINAINGIIDNKEFYDFRTLYAVAHLDAYYDKSVEKVKKLIEIYNRFTTELTKIITKLNNEAENLPIDIDRFEYIGKIYSSYLDYKYHLMDELDDENRKNFKFLYKEHSRISEAYYEFEHIDLERDPRKEPSAKESIEILKFAITLEKKDEVSSYKELLERLELIELVAMGEKALTYLTFVADESRRVLRTRINKES